MTNNPGGADVETVEREETRHGVRQALAVLFPVFAVALCAFLEFYRIPAVPRICIRLVQLVLVLVFLARYHHLSGDLRTRVWLALLILLSIALHFYRLTVIPWVYSDEALQIRIVRDFLAGHMRVDSVTWTGFSAFHPYPVLFYLVVVPLYALTKSILTARFITATGAVVTTILIFMTGRRMKDARMGFWAGLIFTFMPFQTLFTRWGFAAALAMPLVTAAFYFCIDYRTRDRRRSAALAGLFAGLATITIYWAAPIIPIVALVILPRNRRDAAVAAGVALALPLALLAVMTAVHGSDAVRFDLSTLSQTFGGEVGGVEETPLRKAFQGYIALFGLFVPTLGRLKRSLYAFMIMGAFHLLGFLGILLGLSGWRRWSLLAAFALLSILAVSSRGSQLGYFYYPALVFLPFLMLGAGALCSAAFRGMEKLCGREDRASGFYMALVAIPFLLFLVPGAMMHKRLLSGRLDMWGIMGKQYCIWGQDGLQNLREVADFVNDRVSESDVVLTTPLVGHAINGNVTNARQIVAYGGNATHQYPAGTPKERFTSDLALDNISYVVTDYYFLVHTLTLKGVADKIIEMEKRGWHPVFDRYPYTVYARPQGSEENPDFDKAALICDNAPLYFDYAEKRKLVLEYEDALFGFVQAVKAAEKSLKNTEIGEQMLKRMPFEDRRRYFGARAAGREKLVDYCNALIILRLEKFEDDRAVGDPLETMGRSVDEIVRIQLEVLRNTEAADTALRKLLKYCSKITFLHVKRKDGQGALAASQLVVASVSRAIDLLAENVKAMHYEQLAAAHHTVGNIQKHLLGDDEAAQITLEKIHQAVNKAQDLRLQEAE